MKLKSVTGAELALPSDKEAAARYIADTIRNSGFTPDGDRCDWQSMYECMSPKVKDAVSSPDIQPFLSRATEIIWREPLEPLMVVTSLFDRVQAKGLTTQVLAGALGAVTAQDIGESQPYPEVMFQVGSAVQTAWIGKSGVQCAFTDEALRYSTFNIMAKNLQLMGNALVRHKEQKAVSFLRSLGTTLFDNLSPTESLFGVLTGRGIDMVANGTPIMDDLFKGIAHMTEEGFAPDTILVNPLFFYQFIQDPVMRSMFLVGSGGSYFQPWAGNAGPRTPWSNGAMGSMGPSSGTKITPGGSPSGDAATGIAGREFGMNAQMPWPSYSPWKLNVVVSPFVPFDADSGLGDMFLLSSGNVGFYMVDEDVTQVEWRDENLEILKVKLRERYGFAVSNEGQGVGVIKNAKLGRNYWDGVVHAQTMDVDTVIEPDADLGL